MGNQRTVQAKTSDIGCRRSPAIAPKPLSTNHTVVHPLLRLQQQVGNRAVTQIIQTKLKVGQPNDVYEQEADRVANTVMRMPNPPMQRQAEEEKAQTSAIAPPISALVQCQADEKKDETAQAKSLIGPITPLVQRQGADEKKEEQAQMLQRQPEEKKDEQAQMLQRQEADEKKDESAQMLQRQGADEKKDEQAQAKGDSAADVTPALENRIQTMRGGGQSLAEGDRTFFESRFGYDFSGVRIHTDSQADDASRNLNAQAFTIGRDIFFAAGRYEPHTTPGKWLLAHELTHTVQQQPQPLSPQPPTQSSPVATSASGSEVRRQPSTTESTTTANPQSTQAQKSSPQSNVAHSKNLGASAIATVQRQSIAVSSAPPQVQRFGLDTILERIADWATNIPGFTLLTFILGRNPITDLPVERNAINLIRGVIGLIPGGDLIFRALEASGAFERVGSWLSQQLAQLNLTWDGIKALFRRAWDEISITDGISGAIAKVRTIFSPTLDRIRNFAASVGSRVIQFIKEAILQPVGRFARSLPFYPLLTVILGKDPITDEVVERSATNVIRGILLLLPGGEEKFQNLQRSGIIDRAFAWFNEQLTRLNLTWTFIKSLFARVWDSLSINDILSPSAAFERIRSIFGEPVQRIVTFAGAAVRKVAEFIFEGVLTLAGGFGQRVLGIFNRARSVISTIIENPIGFVGNLINAVKRGFQQFSGNILTHLQAGLVGWLLGALASTGLQLPERFDLRGIVSLVMQILGLTYQRLRGILVRLLGSEERVQRAEQIFDFLVTLVRDGIAAAWERIVEFAGNLQEMVLGGIRDWVARTVVGQAIARLVTLFNPAGAIIQAIMAIYNTVVFFIERAQQIGALVEAVFDSISNIAAGNVTAAANYVERTMARTIPVILGFLARFIGLGNVGEQIQNIIRRIQAPIENAMNRLADWIRRQVGNLVSRGLGGDPNAPASERVANALREAVPIVNRYAGHPVGAAILRPLLAPIRLRHRLTSLTVVPQGDIWLVDAAASPGVTAPTAAKVDQGSASSSGSDSANVPSPERLTFGQVIEVRTSRGPADTRVRDPYIWFVATITSVDLARGTIRYESANRKRVTTGVQNISDFNTKWVFGHNSQVRYSVERILEENEKQSWDDINIARAVLNYRHHGDQSGASGMQWEHIIEQHGGGAHSSGNLAITAATINNRLSVLFRYAYASHEAPSGLEGTNGLPLRQYLLDKPLYIKNRWKQHFYATELNVSLKWNRSERGIWRELN
jgi:hypothetical protein